MSWASLIPAAGSILGGIIANRSAHQAADAQAQASQAAMAEQQRQYNQTRQDQMPWLTAGQNALAGQQAVLHGDYSGFQNSPITRTRCSRGCRAWTAAPPHVVRCTPAGIRRTL